MRFEILLYTIDSEVAKFIIQVLESGDDLNVRLHDSPLLTEDIYEQLKRVDMSSACRIHPNDRRKSTRALQIYYTHGLTKSAMLELQRKVNEENRTPLRYKNVCLFSLGCETETLNARLDQRVDQMIANGLLDELVEFKKLFDTQFPKLVYSFRLITNPNLIHICIFLIFLSVRRLNPTRATSSSAFFSP